MPRSSPFLFPSERRTRDNIVSGQTNKIHTCDNLYILLIELQKYKRKLLDNCIVNRSPDATLPRERKSFEKYLTIATRESDL